MGARLMAARGVIQRDPDSEVIHLVVSRLEDDTAMLRHLSEEAMPPILSNGDGGGAMAPARPMAHPRNVQCLPKSRDFH